jgi:hypothetical protein
MPHARQTIREAAATRVTGLTSTSTRVFQSRIVPQVTLPCLLVTTNDEEIVPGTIGTLAERRMDLVITGVAKATSNVDDALDTIAAEVETAMSSFTYRAELQTLTVDFDEGLEKPVGKVALGYKVTYLTAAGAPGTPL